MSSSIRATAACLVLTLGLVGCGKGSSDGKPAAPPTSASQVRAPSSPALEQAKQLIAGGALVVDVRELPEWEEGHLPMAKLYPVGAIGQQLAELEQAAGGKDKPIVLYCRTGSRAAHAKQVLDAAGFTNVFNAGGFRGLSQALGSTTN